MTRIALGVHALVVLTVATGCGTDIVRLASLEGGAGGAGETGAGDAAAPCKTDSDCGDGGDFFCSKTCPDPVTGTSALGTCEPIPPDQCPDTFMPVCGCDLVTYFNDCFRRKEHAGVWYPNVACPMPSFCGALRPCPKGSTCAHVILYGFPGADTCSGLFPGFCWNAPDRCPPDTPQYMPCDGGACVDLCTAIQMGTTYQLAASAQCR